jgi:hypothetical protein
VTEEAILKAINAKLGALLTIAVDQYLRETGLARPKQRTIDRMLADVGLGAKEISALLGKTERAVHLVLAADGKKAKPKKGAAEAAETVGGGNAEEEA